jgi:hypothetical protein
MTDSAEGHPPPEGEVNFSLPLSQGNIREESPFTITLKGNLIFDVSGIARTVTVTMELEPKADEAERTSFSVTQPFNYFPSANHIFLFLKNLKRNFFETVRDAMADEARLQLRDVSRFLTARFEFAPDSKEQITKDHLEATRERIVRFLVELPEKPRHAKWTKYTLERAVRIAALAAYTTDPKKFTLQDVRDEMFKSYREDTPASGDALRKALEEFDVSWSRIKSETRSVADFLKKQ